MKRWFPKHNAATGPNFWNVDAFHYWSKHVVLVWSDNFYRKGCEEVSFLSRGSVFDAALVSFGETYTHWIRFAARHAAIADEHEICAHIPLHLTFLQKGRFFLDNLSNFVVFLMLLTNTITFSIMKTNPSSILEQLSYRVIQFFRCLGIR